VLIETKGNFNFNKGHNTKKPLLDVPQRDFDLSLGASVLGQNACPGTAWQLNAARFLRQDSRGFGQPFSEPESHRRNCTQRAARLRLFAFDHTRSVDRPRSPRAWTSAPH
jgi:hypothetical protein